MAKSSFRPFAEAMSGRIEREVDQALMAIGLEIESTAVESIKDGGIPSPNHVVSRPGEPPNADTHLLDSNVRSEAVIQHRVTIASTAPYAKHLEYGTKRMAARPYMRPALYKNSERARELLSAALARATT